MEFFSTLYCPAGELKKAIIALCLGAAIVVGVEWLVRTDQNPKSLPFHSTRVGTLFDRIERGERTFEYVFLGDSQVAYGVSPDAFANVAGVSPDRCLNLGMPGCNLKSTNRFFKRTASTYETKTLVIGCGLGFAVGSRRDDVINSAGTRAINGELAVESELLLELDLHRYRRQFRDLRYQYYLFRNRRLQGDLERRIGPHGRGWRPAQGNFLASVQKAKVGKKRTFRIVERVFDELDQLFVSAKGRKIQRIVCLIPPHHPLLNDAIENPVSTWQAFMNGIDLVCRRHQVELIDHRSLESLTTKSFVDFTHLTNVAALKYSETLGRVLSGTHEN